MILEITKAGNELTITSAGIGITLSIFTFLVTFGGIIYKIALLNSKTLSNEKSTIGNYKELDLLKSRMANKETEILRLKDKIISLEHKTDRVSVDIKNMGEEFHRMAISLVEIKGDIKSIINYMRKTNDQSEGN